MGEGRAVGSLRITARRISRIGAVLEHVCKVWAPKVVVLEVMLRASWRSIWRSLRGPLGDRFACVLEVGLGFSGKYLEVDLKLVRVFA